MTRAIVSREILDSLIRAKVAPLPDCAEVEALPVTWSPERASGCNWAIPGWLGDGELVRACRERLEHYLAFLQGQFDIPPRGAAGGE